MVQSEAVLVHASSRISYGGNFTLWVLHPYGFPPAGGWRSAKVQHSPAALYGDPKKVEFWEKCSVDYLHEWAFGMICGLSVSKNWTLETKEQR